VLENKALKAARAQIPGCDFFRDRKKIALVLAQVSLHINNEDGRDAA
jgi:hypothetical protein